MTVTALELLVELPQTFRAFLEEDRAVMFGRADAHYCPVAIWLKVMTGASDVRVFPSSVHVDDQAVETPQWISSFLEIFDATRGRYPTDRLNSADVAILCLDLAIPRAKKAA